MAVDGRCSKSIAATFAAGAFEPPAVGRVYQLICEYCVSCLDALDDALFVRLKSLDVQDAYGVFLVCSRFCDACDNLLFFRNVNGIPVDWKTRLKKTSCATCQAPLAMFVLPFPLQRLTMQRITSTVCRKGVAGRNELSRNEKALRDYIVAGIPFVTVQSVDRHRPERMVREIAQENGFDMFLYTDARQVVHLGPETRMPVDGPLRSAAVSQRLIPEIPELHFRAGGHA